MKAIDKTTYLAPKELSRVITIREKKGNVPDDDSRAFALRIVEAIKYDEIKFHSMPIVDGKKGCVQFHELLLRFWDESISVQEAVNCLESWSLLGKVTPCLVETALEHAKGLGSEISLNIPPSAMTIWPRSQLMKVFRNFIDNGGDPKKVILEITEESHLEITDELVNYMNVVRNMGFRWVLDDVGEEGCHTSEHIKQLPIWAIKFDRQHSEGLLNSQVMPADTKEVVELCRSLGIHIVAEHMETMTNAKKIFAWHGIQFSQMPTEGLNK